MVKTKSKIKVLEKKIEELERKKKALSTQGIDRNIENESNSMSRRSFLKKAGLGSAGLAALLSPVSADLFIRDDSFSVETGTSTDELTEYFRVNQGAPEGNGKVEILNTSLAVEQHIETTTGTTIWDSSDGEVPAEQLGIDLQIDGEEITRSDTLNFKTE